MIKIRKRIAFPIQIEYELRISPVFIPVFAEMRHIITIFRAFNRKHPYFLFVQVERHSTDCLKNALRQIWLGRMAKAMSEPLMILGIVNLVQNPSNFLLDSAGSRLPVFVETDSRPR